MVLALPDLDEECHEVEELLHGDVAVAVLVKQVKDLKKGDILNPELIINSLAVICRIGPSWLKIPYEPG